MPVLDGRTPLQAWLDDPTPLSTVPPGDLRLPTLEDDGRTRRTTTKGGGMAGRQYVAARMTGQVGRQVRLRYMPHHEHEVEVFDARAHEHLDAATLADQASPEQIADLRRTREVRRRQLAADLRAAEKSRWTQYAAATTAQPPQPVTAVTATQADAEVGDADDEQLRAAARPRLVPPGPPAPGWVLPRSSAPAPPAADVGDGDADDAVPAGDPGE